MILIMEVVRKKIRQHLIRSKKESIVGQEVQKLELDLCKEDLSSALTTADIDNWYEKQKSTRDPLRNFYYSSKSNKRKRTYELQKQKYVDQLCSKERKYVSSSGNTVPILFVGGRGYGIGSRLKGHSRQGGIWKPKKHGLYTSVCITNEHNASQTYPFCFGKLFHPARTSYNKSGKKKRGCYRQQENNAVGSRQKIWELGKTEFSRNKFLDDFLSFGSDIF
ncbi:hypothetical protein EDC94DRAFT_94556 [Helicostylum pulchrum]|nr:hypothetical protein EDC94DRAFT_94556 [Helicostylum pulchrum]